MGQTVILLWTGGWDSTFRLLQLLHDTDANIQPLYLVDEERGSTPREIDTMRKIRGMIEERTPKATDRFLPTDYGSYRGTKIEPDHREQWEALKECGRVGLQYPVLASYAEQNGIDRMELSVEGRANSNSTIVNVLEPLFEIEETAGGELPVVSEEADDPAAMLRYFTFPLIRYTKLDMKEEAERRGWMPIMKQTWFCFSPTFGLPCGSCQPCKIAEKEGMGDRVGHLGPILFTMKTSGLRARTAAVLQKVGLKSVVKSIRDY